MSAQQVDEFGASFIRLALEVNRHIEGYVDAYYGPEEIFTDVENSSLVPPEQLLESHKRLRDITPDGDAGRHRHLVHTLNAMECTIRKLNGEAFEFLDEVEQLFGISPVLVDEGEFLQTHRELDTILPGGGPLGERMERRRKDLELQSAALPDQVKAILPEIRHRSGQVVPSVPGEGVDFEWVDHKPYAANCEYLGEYRSQIQVNLDREWDTLGLLDLLTHEAYPGHHTELQMKEKRFFRDKGYAEEACILLFAPSSLIAEAIATTAMEILSTGTDFFEWVAGELIPGLNQRVVEADELSLWHKSEISLKRCGSNAAILYHSGELGERDVLEYLETYSLVSRKRAQQSFQFIKNPLYRTYVFNYTEGYRLLEDAADGGSKLPVFLKMINEHILPGDLMAA